jgi:hypothetical protein
MNKYLALVQKQKVTWRLYAQIIVMLFILNSFICSDIFTQALKFADRPLAKDAGRVIKTKEIFRITGESGNFYFKNPGPLQIANDGTLFICDEYQLLHFTESGKYIKNIYKKGQEPGEISGTFDFFNKGNEIYTYARGSNIFFE